VVTSKLMFLLAIRTLRREHVLDGVGNASGFPVHLEHEAFSADELDGVRHRRHGAPPVNALHSAHAISTLHVNDRECMGRFASLTGEDQIDRGNRERVL